MKKLLMTLALAASMIHAETVYFTAHGKTFHKSEHCMALSRAKHVYEAERADALAHKLHECGICYRKASAKKDAAPPAWATEVVKPTTGKAQ
jgi:hypothetical protein